MSPFPHSLGALLSSRYTPEPLDTGLSCEHTDFSSWDTLDFHLGIIDFCPLSTSFQGCVNFPLDMLLVPLWAHVKRARGNDLKLRQGRLRLYVRKKIHCYGQALEQVGITISGGVSEVGNQCWVMIWGWHWQCWVDGCAWCPGNHQIWAGKGSKDLQIQTISEQQGSNHNLGITSTMLWPALKTWTLISLHHLCMHWLVALSFPPMNTAAFHDNLDM